MKRFFALLYVLMAGTLLFASASTAFAQEDDDDDDYVDAHMPVYLYLTADISDHINLDISEDRLRRILPMVEKYRKMHPETGVSATVLFSGAASQALAARNPQTHIVDFVLDYLRRGVIEVGYDGTDEPTYKQRPVIDLSQSKTPQERWLVRSAAAERYLTEARDPLSGAVQPGQVGGLKKMQEVFGEASIIAGVTLGLPDLYSGIVPELGGDTEIVHQIRRYNTKALMLGVTEENVTHDATYRKWTAAFGNAMSAGPDAPPELYWQDGVLRSSESFGVDNRLFHAYNGPAAFSFVLNRLDRQRIRIIHVELGNERNYLTKPFRADYAYPPMKYAYNHPDNPQLPAAARKAAKEVDVAYANEDGLLEWLATDAVPEQLGNMRFVSSADLKKLTPPGWGYDLPVKDLRSALEALMKTWGDDPAPPKYLEVRERFLSLSEMFQVMADALAEMNRTGKLPETVRVAHVYGLASTIRDIDAILGEVTAASVARAAAAIDGPLHDDSWKPVPANLIPARIKVNDLNLNAGQFLRLMAEALLASSPETKLQVKRTDLFWGPEPLRQNTRRVEDEGVIWTYKPAPVLWPRAFDAKFNRQPGE